MSKESLITSEPWGGGFRTTQTVWMPVWAMNPDRKWWSFWRPKTIEKKEAVTFTFYHKEEIDHNAYAAGQTTILCETTEVRCSETLATLSHTYTTIADRQAVKSAMMDYADALLTGGDPDPNEYADRILAAIEAERPAIEAAERERLAKLAEEFMAGLPYQHESPQNGSCTYNWWADFVKFIRSQGETK